MASSSEHLRKIFSRYFFFREKCSCDTTLRRSCEKHTINDCYLSILFLFYCLAFFLHSFFFFLATSTTRPLVHSLFTEFFFTCTSKLREYWTPKIDTGMSLSKNWVLHPDGYFLRDLHQPFVRGNDTLTQKKMTNAVNRSFLHFMTQSPKA